MADISNTKIKLSDKLIVDFIPVKLVTKVRDLNTEDKYITIPVDPVEASSLELARNFVSDAIKSYSQTFESHDQFERYKKSHLSGKRTFFGLGGFTPYAVIESVDSTTGRLKVGISYIPVDDLKKNDPCLEFTL